jgi:hypothetical protein
LGLLMSMLLWSLTVSSLGSLKFGVKLVAIMTRRR